MQKTFVMFRLLVLLVLWPAYMYAQQEQDSTSFFSPAEEPDLLKELQQRGTQEGHAIITADPFIDNLLDLHIRQNEDKKAFTGYRIQIYSANSFGCDLDALKTMRDNFEQSFQDIPAYLTYIGPDFKIRVGNFRSRLGCIPTLHRVRKLYPASYPVKTEITLEELNRVPMQDIPQKPAVEETEEMEEIEETAE